MSVFNFEVVSIDRAFDMRDQRIGIKTFFRSLESLVRETKNAAAPDKDFEVVWLPANEVCEGSRLRGFLTVQIVEFGQDTGPSSAI
jgi:hypothetical protein